MNAEIHSWDDLPPQPVIQGLTRKVIAGLGSTLVMNYIEPGTVIPEHTHAHAQIMHVLRGKGKVLMNGKEMPLDGGSLVIVPPEMSHGYVVEGDEINLMLDIFVPNRTEYEEQYQQFLQQSR